MVTFECKEKTCPQANIKIDFLGDLSEAECGGCKLILKSFNLREDPEMPKSILETKVAE